MNPDQKTPRPTRNPWPIAIIAYFIAFFSFTVGLVVWAVHQKVDLVSPNYYDDEIAFQKRIDDVKRTEPVRGMVSVVYDTAAQTVIIKVPDVRHRIDTKGSVQFYRPSDERLDRTVPLALDSSGEQMFDAKVLANGLWKVHLQWVESGKDYYFDQTLVLGGRI